MPRLMIAFEPNEENPPRRFRPIFFIAEPNLERHAECQRHFRPADTLTHTQFTACCAVVEHRTA